jgi:hypothetical protein
LEIRWTGSGPKPIVFNGPCGRAQVIVSVEVTPID